MAYIGNKLADAYTSFAKQDFTTSATTSYTLDNPVANENEIALFINFVRQEPTTAYTASGTSLTLTSATSASDDMYAIFLGKAVQTVNPPIGSVGTSQLANGAVTSAKLDSGLALGKVLQVVNATAGVNNTNSASYVATTCTLSITPSSTSNKILLLGSVNCANGSNFYVNLKFYRNGSDVSGVVAAHYGGTNAQNAMMYLDSPSSNSALTYTIYFNASGSTSYLDFLSMTAIEIVG